jgi:hypothetical protein
MIVSRENETGAVTVEFVMVCPVLAAAMLFLIGMGYTLMTKQNAVAGARATVFASAWDHDPQLGNLNEDIKNAVSPQREEWQVSLLSQSLEPDPDLKDVGESSPDLDLNDGAGLLQGVVSGLYQALNREIGYEVSTLPSLGFVPGVLKLERYGLRARARYYLPHGTWSCKQTGAASYFGMGVNAGLSAIGVEVNRMPGWVKDILDPGCCDSYDESYERGP